MDGARRIRIGLRASKLAGMDSGGAETMNPSLEVNRDQMVEAFTFMNRQLRGQRSGNITFAFQDGTLTVDVGNITITAEASGEWPDKVAVPSKVLKSLAIVNPRQDPVKLWVEDGKLHYGPTSVACKKVKT